MRSRAIEGLRTGVLDVLILGGGINGAGTARDLALRARYGGVPLRIGLAEAGHFASGTSGKNSQLIHGGLRYLKLLEFRLVREALTERARLLALAPPLVRPQPFLIPLGNRAAELYYRAGLSLYDGLAGSRNIGRHAKMERREFERIEPELARGFRCALRFYDGAVHSARFVLANIFDAAALGVAAANYVRCAGRERSRDLWRVSLEDTLTGERFEARARKLVDATGAWQQDGSLRLVRGSHIVLPRLNASDHAVAWFEPGGRIVFVIPWGEQGNVSLIGTTDVDHTEGPGNVRISSEEIAYLMRSAKALFPSAGTKEPVAAFSSLRPLLRDGSASASSTSREHRIWNDRDGVLRIAGGKYTTYRLMSEEAADLAAREIAPALAPLHPTREEPITLAEPGDPSEPGRIFHAVRYEMAQRLPDLMFVSTYWGYERRWDSASLAPYASELGRHLGWDRGRERQEVETVLCALALPGA